MVVIILGFIFSKYSLTFFMKKLSIFCAVCFVLSALGYTTEDISNANYLADQKIVTKQTTGTGYRLDDKILRQEVIGMALKVKGITLPENYTCKKYFADATKNDWVCRAVELAADNGIISRSNKYANPGKSITKSEALAMVMNAWGITYAKNITYTGYKASTPKWQIDVVEWAVQNWILKTAINFWVDKEALRKEVFEFAKKTKISNFDEIYSNEVISFRYPSEYYDIYDGIIKKTYLKTEGETINIWLNDTDWIQIIYLENKYTEQDILDILYEDEFCNTPSIKNKEYLSSWATMFSLVHLKTLEKCNSLSPLLHFPKEWILISIQLGNSGTSLQFLDDSWQFNSDDVSYNTKYHPYIQGRMIKFLESFKVITK